MSLKHAWILNQSGTRAADVEVMFNPTELSITRGASYAEIQVPGLDVPLLQYVRGEAQVLTVELFLDGSDKRKSVRAELDKLRKYVSVDSDLHAPPVCQFSWGDTQFVGVMTQLQEKFSLFDENGNILRARVNVSIKSYEPVEVQAQQMATSSPDRFKTRVVKQGDRLDLIAADEYGDPNQWRVIADANQLHRPRRLVAGAVLAIPPL